METEGGDILGSIHCSSVEHDEKLPSGRTEECPLKHCKGRFLMMLMNEVSKKYGLHKS